MTLPRRRPLTREAVVVAIGPDERGYEAALAYAVREARHVGRPLHLVHAVTRPEGPAGPAGHTGRSRLRTAVARAVALVADGGGGGDDALPVTASIVDGRRLVRALVDSADAGSLAVLQHRRLAPAHRLIARSVVDGVAARAHVPVVAVPADWTLRADSRRVVTVGVQDPAEASSLVGLAARAAVRRGARLDVLHASWAADDLGQVVADVRERHPGLEVVLAVRHSPAALALLDAADRSGLLVVGRRHHRLPRGTHLGPVARAVLDHSRCPVLVAPEPGAAERSAGPAAAAC